MIYYLGYFDKSVDDEFHVLATSKSGDAAIFILRAYNKYNRECCDYKYDYRMFRKGELPEHWVYEKETN